MAHLQREGRFGLDHVSRNQCRQRFETAEPARGSSACDNSSNNPVEALDGLAQREIEHVGVVAEFPDSEFEEFSWRKSPGAERNNSDGTLIGAIASTALPPESSAEAISAWIMACFANTGGR